MVDFREPEKLIGSNTVGSITSGLYYGFVGMIDGILERLGAELGPDMKTVATGGQGHMIVRSSRWVKMYEEDLTLEGLRLIWERNCGPVKPLMQDPALENYFNYFTEIEEHFRIARGTGLFLISPLDWALIEAWKNAGVPLEAVLRGIDAAFEKWRAKPAASAHAEDEFAGVLRPGGRGGSAGDGSRTLRARARQPRLRFRSTTCASFSRATRRSAKAGQDDLAASLEALDAEALYADLEQLEQRLTAIEEKMIARLRVRRQRRGVV